jgi:phage shock protein PspC (stress-responsive transcriptional regulator)
MQVNRRLYRCRENRVLAGVASGVAEFFGLDPTLVRVLWFLSIFAGGVSLLLYIGLAIIVPLEPLPEGSVVAHTEPVESHRHGRGGGGQWVTFFGIALVLLGSLALIGTLLPNVASWRYLGPLFIIGMGAVLVFGALRRDAPVPAAGPSALVPSSPSPPEEPTET